jgi:hypothetical protein
MNRITSFLALSAIVVAGAFAGTAAQASANVTVNFKVHNADATASMIRSGAPSAGISALISPAVSISPGNDDPAAGFAVFSLPTPNVGSAVSGSVSYANANDGVSNLCTFTLTVTRNAPAAYTLSFAIAPGTTNCSVPGNAANSTGQFTTTTYTLAWST